VKVDAHGKSFYPVAIARMKWIAVLCFAGWLVCAGLPAFAQGLPDDLIVKGVTVDGQAMPTGPNGLKLGARPGEVIFHFGSPDNLHLPDKRVRYKLEGYDSDWRDGGCYMFLAVRFYNETGDEVGQEDFKVAGDSAGWKGSFINSALTHRREVVTVPAHASRLLIVISSGGPPATIGNYVVANLAVRKMDSNTVPVTLLEFSPDGKVDEKTNLNLNDWIRDGNVPSMAKIVTVGRSPAQKALAILDNNPTSHAEWHNALVSAPAVTPGDQVSVEWNEMYSMGVADLHVAPYQKLPEGHYTFRLAEFDLYGKPDGKESSMAVIVPPPLWRQPLFWPLCAILATAIAFGNWRYVAWRKVRHEMTRLKNQQALEKERLRIAQDIHDDLGARITEISLASALAKKNPALPAVAGADFERISNMSRDLVAALYETVWAVNPENDNLDSLGTYLCQIANNLCKPAQVPCRLELDELPRNVHVSSQIRHNIAMAVKEAVHNAVKHSLATEITLRMSFKKPELIICVHDNGTGFKADDETVPGHGLKNIKRRLANIGAHCQIDSRDGNGTSIQMQIEL
jgi:signal transduction histidine kinase